MDTYVRDTRVDYGQEEAEVLNPLAVLLSYSVSSILSTPALRQPPRMPVRGILSAASSDNRVGKPPFRPVEHVLFLNLMRGKARDPRP